MSAVTFEEIEALTSIQALIPEAEKEFKLVIAPANYRWFALKSGGEVIGFAAIVPIKSGFFPVIELDGEMLYKKASGTEIKYCYIAPEHRRKGMGSKLMKKLLAKCTGVVKATILPSTLAFYERHGFTQKDSKGRYPIVFRG